MTAAAYIICFFSQLRDLLNFDVIDKEADTLTVHRIGIERELVVVPFGRVGRNGEFKFPMLPAVFGGNGNVSAGEQNVVELAVPIPVISDCSTSRC